MKSNYTGFVLGLFMSASLVAQAQNNWVAKANFGGVKREGGVSFSIGSKGYIGTGMTGPNISSRDFWEYDPANNTWTQKANVGGSNRTHGVGLSVGNKGYIGLGQSFAQMNTLYSDFWEYDPANNTWTQRTNFPGGARAYPVGFGINTKAYVGTGGPYPALNDFYEFDPATNIWLQKANFAGTGRYGAVGFSIGSKGYIGTGDNQGTYFNDFWEYDPANDTWLQKASMPTLGRDFANGLSIGNKGFVGIGRYGGNGLIDDFWEFDPIANTWTQRANYGGGTTYFSTAFSIGQKGYMGIGYKTPINDYSKDFWEYTPICVGAPAAPGAISGPVTICEGSTNTYSITAINGATSYAWTLPNGWTGSSVTTSISATASATSGNITVTANNPCGNSQPQVLAVTVNPVYTTNTTATICQGDSMLLAGAYQKTGGNYTDLLQSISGCDSTVITALTVNPLPTVTLSNQTAVCVDLPAFALSGGSPAGGTYSGTGVSNNQFDPNAAGAGTHTITYTYTDANTGCSSSATNTIVVNALPTVTMAGMSDLCADNPPISLTNGLPVGGTYSGPGVSNGMFSATVAGAGTHTITYTYTDANTGCSNSASKTIVVNPLPPVPTITTNGNTFTSSSATGNQWYMNGNPVNGATSQSFTCTGNGNYSVCVTDANGCKSCSQVLNFTTFGISEEQAENAVTVYPNPFNTLFAVIASEAKQSTIIVYNTLGEVVYSNQITNQPLTINLSEAPAGIYIVQVKTERGISVTRILKE